MPIYKLTEPSYFNNMLMTYHSLYKCLTTKENKTQTKPQAFLSEK